MIVSFSFFGVLVLGALVFWALPAQKLRTAWLTIASLGFILLHDRFAALMALLLAGYTYGVAGLMERRGKSKIVFRLGISGLIVVLVLFKYLGFLAGTISGIAAFVADWRGLRLEPLLLPLGLSYLVFKYLSYLADIHWGLVKKGRFLDVLLYGSLFTIFVAGPIERFERFGPQLETAGRFRMAFVEEAFTRIVFGLFKKLAIADWLGYFLAPVWDRPEAHGLGLKALALVGFSLQIYLDFSAYSDIAIGASRLFGLKIMENFRWPYLQPNIGRFWSHWHISLSSWIRDYLFFPLSRVSRNRLWLSVAVPLIAMALCGLWHGPAWHFVLWGLWHGAGIAIWQAWAARRRARGRPSPGTASVPARILATLTTFTFVTVGWLWFR